jgi:hypothetical protein
VPDGVPTMPDQLTLATQVDGGFEARHKSTRRDLFLAEMDKVVPWLELCAVIDPFYPKVRAEGPSPGGCGAYAARPLSAAVECTERSGRLGGAVRLGVDATIRRD